MFPLLEDEVALKAYPPYAYLLFTLPIILDAKLVVELGLGWGHSTRIFLDALGQLEGERSLLSIELDRDTYQPVVDKINSEKPTNVRWHVEWKDSIDAGKEFAMPLEGTNKTPIDLLYLDSNHQYEHVLKEIELFGPFVTDKGIIIADDSWCSSPETHHGDGLDHNPTDTYLALSKWGKEHGWNEMLFRAAEGMTLLYRRR